MMEWIEAAYAASSVELNPAEFEQFVLDNGFEYEMREGDDQEPRMYIPLDTAPTLLHICYAPEPHRSVFVNDAKAQIAQGKRGEFFWDQEHKREQKREEDESAKAALDTMLTASYSEIPGYRILRHGGYVSAVCAVDTTSGLIFARATNLETAVEDSSDRALDKLKGKALDLGCNGIVDLNIDFASVDSRGLINTQLESHFMVVRAYGSAVQLEPISE